MTIQSVCPGCGRHCNLKEPQCGRGREYLRRQTERAEEISGVSANSSEEEKRCGCAEHEHVHIRRAEYESMDTDSRLIVNLRDAGHMIRFLYEGKGSQKRILIILHETGGMTQRELTEKMGVQPGSASEVIGKLESAGLILRTPSASDRRTTDVRLTPEGAALAEEALRQRKIRHQEMFSCLTEQEKETLLGLAEKLNADWDDRYRERETGRHGRRGEGREEGRPGRHGGGEEGRPGRHGEGKGEGRPGRHGGRA